MSDLATIQTTTLGGTAIATLSGEVDLSNAQDLGERLRSHVTNQHSRLLVDLSGITYLDSAGLRLLFELALTLRDHRQEIHVVVPPESQASRTIAITGLGTVLTIHPSMESAEQQLGLSSRH